MSAIAPGQGTTELLKLLCDWVERGASVWESTSQGAARAQPTEVVEDVEVFVEEGVGHSDQTVRDVVGLDLSAGGRLDLFADYDEVFEFGLGEFVGWSVEQAEVEGLLEHFGGFPVQRCGGRTLVAVSLAVGPGVAVGCRGTMGVRR